MPVGSVVPVPQFFYPGNPNAAAEYRASIPKPMHLLAILVSARTRLPSPRWVRHEGLYP